MNDDAFYSDSQRAAQDRFESRPLADMLEAAIVTDQIDPDEQQPFLESRDFFFLSTVNKDGEPTVSYKGGGVGVVAVVNPKTIAFPIYDGNGMFLSVGNIEDTAKIGLLFIDFETPNRLRIQATAQSTNSDDELMEKYPGALVIVRATVDKVFVNCARYIHKHARVEASPYVPDVETGEQPFPAWKRIDALQDSLHPGDKGKADEAGGLITIDEYAEKLEAGES